MACLFLASEILPLPLGLPLSSTALLSNFIRLSTLSSHGCGFFHVDYKGGDGGEGAINFGTLGIGHRACHIADPPEMLVGQVNEVQSF